MRITNYYNLPNQFLKLFEEQEIEDNKFSVTELVRPTKQLILLRRLNNELEIDISEMMPAIVGKSIHKVLEIYSESKNCLIEQRFERKCNGITIIGKPDLVDIDNKILYDFKTASVFSFKYLRKDGVNERYKLQVNLYRWLLKDYEIDKLILIFFYRDWIRSTKEEFPLTPIVTKEVEKIDTKEVLGYVKNKTKEIEKYKDEPIDKIPNCYSNRNICDNYCMLKDFCFTKIKTKKNKKEVKNGEERV